MGRQLLMSLQPYQQPPINQRLQPLAQMVQQADRAVRSSHRIRLLSRLSKGDHPSYLPLGRKTPQLQGRCKKALHEVADNWKAVLKNNNRELIFTRGCLGSHAATRPIELMQCHRCCLHMCRRTSLLPKRVHLVVPWQQHWW